MSKVILLLGLALVLLGFLMSTNMNMYNDAYDLNARIEELRQDLERLRYSFGVLRQENEDLRAENDELRLELKDREGAKVGSQITATHACSPVLWQALLPASIPLADIFPF